MVTLPMYLFRFQSVVENISTPMEKSGKEFSTRPYSPTHWSEEFKRFKSVSSPAGAGSIEERNFLSWKLNCRQGCQRYESFGPASPAKKCSLASFNVLLYHEKRMICSAGFQPATRLPAARFQAIKCQVTLGLPALKTIITVP